MDTIEILLFRDLPMPDLTSSSESTHPLLEPRPEKREFTAEQTLLHDSGNTPVAETLTLLAQAESPDEIGRLAHYRVLRELGHGGMGCVLLAEDTKLKRQVALKIMLPTLAQDPLSRERFLREARAAAGIRHDHVITVYQVDEINGVPYFTMEYLKGMSLDQYLRDRGPLPVDTVLHLARQIALGLEAAHAQGLIHRDIKPANIWLETPNDRVKLLDFGLVRSETDDTYLTQQGLIVGTPAYMSPEQARGETVDFRSDLFSLGVVLYRLCTGKQPFSGPSYVAVLTAIVVDTPPPPRSVNPGLPEALDRVIVRLLEKDPARRYSSASELLTALKSISPTTPNPSSESTPPWAGRSRWILGLVGVALFVGMLGLLLAHRGSQPVSDPTPAQPAVLAATFTNELGMEFIRIGKGTAWLGGGGGKPGAIREEIPHDFYLGKYEVTQEEWDEVTGHAPSFFSRTGGGQDALVDVADADLKRYPVEMVSWEDTQTFLERLNRRVKEGGWIYRLPRETEWEYACRGGHLSEQSTSGFHFYLERPANQLLPEQANFEHGMGLKRPCRVGMYKPNRLGLFDLHGNVGEWCDDEMIVEGVSRRTYRGGGWFLDQENCQAAYRFSLVPSFRNFNLGLRLARVPVQSGAR